jgi:hypothetical protein
MTEKCAKCGKTGIPLFACDRDDSNNWYCEPHFVEIGCWQNHGEGCSTMVMEGPNHITTMHPLAKEADPLPALPLMDLTHPLTMEEAADPPGCPYKHVGCHIRTPALHDPSVCGNCGEKL